MAAQDHGLPTSGFWTWDHATHWSDDMARVESGCMNRYLRAPESFLEDYRRLMDYMAEKEIPYVIIWGLFRDAHGGEAAVHELLRIARAKGVGVLAGVGINAYGGFYYEGDHPWSLEARLRKHPELASVRERPVWSDYPHVWGTGAACPSKEENVRWHEEGIRWLLENFDLAGVNLETGDYGLCHCPECTRLAAGRRDTNWSFDDMALVLPPVIRTALAVRPDAVITYASYSPFTEAMVGEPPAFVRAIPPEAICQWTATEMTHRGLWGDDRAFRPPTRRSTVLSHWGSQWTTPHSRYLPIVRHLRETCARSHAAGLEGVFIQGEAAPHEPTLGSSLVVRANYEALSYFTAHPRASIDDLARDRLAGLFGGPERAVKALRWLTEQVGEGEIADRRKGCLAEADALDRTDRAAAHAWRAAEGILFARTL